VTLLLFTAPILKVWVLLYFDSESLCLKFNWVRLGGTQVEHWFAFVTMSVTVAV